MQFLPCLFWAAGSPHISQSALAIDMANSGEIEYLHATRTANHLSWAPGTVSILRLCPVLDHSFTFSALQVTQYFVLESAPTMGVPHVTQFIIRKDASGEYHTR